MHTVNAIARISADARRSPGQATRGSSTAAANCKLGSTGRVFGFYRTRAAALPGDLLPHSAEESRILAAAQWSASWLQRVSEIWWCELTRMPSSAARAASQHLVLCLPTGALVRNTTVDGPRQKQRRMGTHA